MKEYDRKTAIQKLQAHAGGSHQRKFETGRITEDQLQAFELEGLIMRWPDGQVSVTNKGLRAEGAKA